jgi:glucuronoarabinoxylan endo-1,4-beta-xylanase
MKNNFIKLVGLLLAGIMLHSVAQAAEKQATIRINSNVSYQKITGFGGFVNSPQFTYNHMTEAEIRKLWGENSVTGYNIMRLYIPVAGTTGTTNWNQCVATAKLAKELGLIVFASPWSMPADWKEYNTVNAVYDDNGTRRDNYLKEEYYDDYADYLERFVQYLRNNGVELDAISIQNEPDERASYAGCIWTPAQIAKFLRENRDRISCPVIAPEPVGLKDEYADALLADDMLPHFDIFGGHQYMSPQSHHRQFHAKGKEVWMTEYLISWPDGSRNVNWATDAFDFAGKINLCMTMDVNAWIHYAAKRYYALMGDGLNGTTTGEITKRGYILSHFAKYTTGTTRIENTWNDNTGLLEGSSFLSVTGDSVIAMIINPSNDSYTLTVDLPFFTTSGKSITTTESANMSESDLGLSEETCRPKVDISASSVTTLIFTKSNERTPSQMSGETINYYKIEDQTVTNSAFGDDYRLSGKTVTFRSSIPLISANTDVANGYLELNDPYNMFVLHVNSVTSTGSLVSGNTTLRYINDNGEVKTHLYEDAGDAAHNINFKKTTDFDWIFDISRQILTDGCKGIIGITCSNYSSVLTLNLGDVFFRMGDERAFKFTGTYNRGDSYLLDCLENPAFTSLDFRGVAGITADEDWHVSAANKNCIYLVDDGGNAKTNVVSGTSCNALRLTDEGGDFHTPFGFFASAASYTRTLNGYDMLVLPFEATIPDELEVYTVVPSTDAVSCTAFFGSTIPANVPVLVKGSGTFTFEGFGAVSSPLSRTVNDMTGVYISVKAPAGSYYLKTDNGVTAFHQITAGSEPAILPFSAYMTTTLATGTTLPLSIIEVVEAAKAAIENGTYQVAQETANDEESIKAWLISTLDALFGQSHGVQFRSTKPSIVGDVMVAAITPATAGTETDPAGTNGSFAFSVTLTYGETTLTTTATAGIIIATPYTGTGINEVPQVKLLKAWIQNGTLHVGGLTAGKPWKVYNIPGTLVYSRIASDNEANVNLPVRGVYIVVSGNDAVKVVY